MASLSVFSRIFVAQRELEDKTTALLKLWFPTYLREIESQLSLPVGLLVAPKERNYTNRNKFDALAGEDIPKVVVISPGIVGTPTKTGQGRYRATWRLGIGVATAATSEEEAKLQCDMYGAAVRTIMLQQGGGALNAADINWLDEQYVDLPISDQLNQYRAASIWFSVDIENVATRRGGPDIPDNDPYGYGTADTIDIELTKEELNGNS